MAAQSKESHGAIRQGLKELEEYGFLTRKQFKNEQGRWENEYQLYEKPHTENLHTEKPHTENLYTKKERPSKKDKVKKKEGSSVALRAPTPSQIAQQFFSDKADHSELINFFTAKGIPENSVVQELHKFKMYWTEPNKSGTKERWQMQKTFEIRRRLLTWFNRADQSYSKSPREAKPIETCDICFVSPCVCR
jgi:hypothetical protein